MYDILLFLQYLLKNIHYWPHFFFFWWRFEINAYEANSANRGIWSPPCQPALYLFSSNHLLEWEQKASTILGRDRLFCSQSNREPSQPLSNLFRPSRTTSQPVSESQQARDGGPPRHPWPGAKQFTMVPPGTAADGANLLSCPWVRPSLSCMLPHNPPWEVMGLPLPGRGLLAERRPDPCVVDTESCPLLPWADGYSSSWKARPHGTHLVSFTDMDKPSHPVHLGNNASGIQKQRDGDHIWAKSVNGLRKGTLVPYLLASLEQVCESVTANHSLRCTITVHAWFFVHSILCPLLKHVLGSDSLYCV